jgi:hypothetical protein
MEAWTMAHGYETINLKIMIITTTMINGFTLCFETAYFGTRFFLRNSDFTVPEIDDLNLRKVGGKKFNILKPSGNYTYHFL